MSRGASVLASLVAAVVVAAPASADQAKSVTATGTGQAKVMPKNPNSNASIQAAVDAARQVAIPAALNQAREYALQYAQAAGLTLGSVISVSDQSSGGGFYGPGPFFIGPFGPNQYCGETARPVFKTVHGKRKLVRVKRVHTCIVPSPEFITLTVTYAAS